VDLGGEGNLVVAMVIATIKAALVVTYFMLLRWDRRMHLLAFLSSVLFLILFLSLAITDRREYMPDVLRLEEAQGAQQ
jgi:cytochrome c oxidase subunit 4